MLGWWNLGSTIWWNDEVVEVAAVLVVVRTVWLQKEDADMRTDRVARNGTTRSSVECTTVQEVPEVVHRTLVFQFSSLVFESFRTIECVPVSMACLEAVCLRISIEHINRAI